MSETDLAAACNIELPILGCFDRMTGIIYLLEGLPEAVRKCVRSHELRHSKGWSHPLMQLSFLDCGNGTFLSATTIGGMQK